MIIINKTYVFCGLALALVVLTLFYADGSEGTGFAIAEMNQIGCFDSDGGQTPGIYGQTSGEAGRDPYIHNDICINPTSVEEKYCNGAISTSAIIQCPAGNICVEGHCVADPLHR